MQDLSWLAGTFEAERSRLRAIAYRMLGSLSEADDAVQETWLRLSRADANVIENLGGWLTTVVARICLDLLRARTARREDLLGAATPDTFVSRDPLGDPEHEALLADAVGLALLVVLDRLAPAERLAFVLHDIFAVPFGEIAPIVGRSADAARKLASRARQRVRGTPAASQQDLARQAPVVAAFLAAARSGDFAALLAVLDPELEFHADPVALPAERARTIRSAADVARQFAGRATAADLVLVNGAVGVVVAPRGRLRLVIALTVRDGKILAVDVIADRERLHRLALAVVAV